MTTLNDAVKAALLPSVRLGFNGKLLESLTGHYVLGHGYRAYNPVLLRFLQPDNWSPFGLGGLNPYGYCVGDPVNNSDPTGHSPWRHLVGMQSWAPRQSYGDPRALINSLGLIRHRRAYEPAFGRRTPTSRLSSSASSAPSSPHPEIATRRPDSPVTARQLSPAASSRPAPMTSREASPEPAHRKGASLRWVELEDAIDRRDIVEFNKLSQVSGLGKRSMRVLKQEMLVISPVALSTNRQFIRKDAIDMRNSDEVDSTLRAFLRGIDSSIWRVS